MSWPKFKYPQCCFIASIFETYRNIPGLMVFEETGFTADKGKETRLKRICGVRSNRVYSGAGVWRNRFNSRSVVFEETSLYQITEVFRNPSYSVVIGVWRNWVLHVDQRCLKKLFLQRINCVKRNRFKSNQWCSKKPVFQWSRCLKKPVLQRISGVQRTVFIADQWCLKRLVKTNQCCLKKPGLQRISCVRRNQVWN